VLSRVAGAVAAPGDIQAVAFRTLVVGWAGTAGAAAAVVSALPSGTVGNAEARAVHETDVAFGALTATAAAPVGAALPPVAGREPAGSLVTYLAAQACTVLRAVGAAFLGIAHAVAASRVEDAQSGFALMEQRALTAVAAAAIGTAFQTVASRVGADILDAAFSASAAAVIGTYAAVFAEFRLAHPVSTAISAIRRACLAVLVGVTGAVSAPRDVPASPIHALMVRQATAAFPAASIVATFR
jgi:hypothetical protein